MAAKDGKKYLLDDNEREAPTDDYLAYAGSADVDSDRSAKRKKWLIGGFVVVIALAVLIGIIAYALMNKDKDKPTTPIWQQWRLLKNVVPSSYNVSLRIDLDALQFSGTSTVAVGIADTPMDSIFLHSLYLVIDSVTVTVDGAVAPISYQLVGQNETDYQYLVLTGLDKWQFPVTSLLYITTTFHRDLPNNTSSGLYATYYTSATGQQVPVAATQFEPTHSRRAFPNFDELQMKAVFNVTMEVKQGLVALTNAPNVSTTNIDSGFQRVVFAPTIRQSSYLMAFAVPLTTPLPHLHHPITCTPLTYIPLCVSVWFCRGLGLRLHVRAGQWEREWPLSFQGLGPCGPHPQ